MCADRMESVRETLLKRHTGALKKDTKRNQRRPVVSGQQLRKRAAQRRQSQDTDSGQAPAAAGGSAQRDAEGKRARGHQEPRGSALAPAPSPARSSESRGRVTDTGCELDGTVGLDLRWTPRTDFHATGDTSQLRIQPFPVQTPPLP